MAEQSLLCLLFSQGIEYNGRIRSLASVFSGSGSRRPLYSTAYSYDDIVNNASDGPFFVVVVVLFFYQVRTAVSKNQPFRT